MWLTGPVAPRHVGSSQTRARTRVPCIGRQILNHCATREAQFPHFFFFLNIYLSLAALGLHCCAWAFSSCREQWLLLLWSTGSVVVAHGLQNVGSVVVVHGLVAPRHVGSSGTRARTRVPCIGRRILNHCATREAQCSLTFNRDNK